MPTMKHILTSVLAALCLTSHAQGSVRATPSVQPAAAPVIGSPVVVPPPPAVTTPTLNPRPMPMPQGVPANLVEEAIDRTAPLTPDEIRELRSKLEDRSNAMNEPLSPVGKPVRRLVNVDLSPGSLPEIIRVSYGQGGVVTFLDAAGRAWPVIAVENFSPRGLDVAVLGSNGVSIAVKSPTARIANLAVQLESLASPVTLSVAIGQSEIDYSVEMQLPRYLPGAPAPVGAVEALPTLAASDLLNYLLGTVPKVARSLKTNMAGVQAWQISPETMVVRTEALLASPRYSRRQSSANGLTVYELPVSPRLILAAQGQMQQVAISGFDATKEQK